MGLNMSEKEFYQVSLKAILRDSEGRILVMKCVPESSKAGYYEFPGGRIDKDEFHTPLTEILTRELTEELGSTVKFLIHQKPVAVGRHLIPKGNIPVLMMFFEVDYISGDIKTSSEHDGFEWFNIQTTKLEDLFVSGDLEGIMMYVRQSK